ncbi:proteasome subunit alpha [Saccharopolyspora rosea]|uniref:Proteasome subunit alpha n=1 Tax=Saccharopolyspora rosea TaxID=524884 RepID=A0ABW3FU32_9PSEU|nr:proteasome subunit alpha [Saccharopolyspora rosea]
MTMPFYTSPEQLMRERSELARKGIARGRSVVVLKYAGGVLFVAENPSPTLHKVSEIYDRIGFAAVGRYSEFEALRVAGVRIADVRGYSYDRRDVTGRSLANTYAQHLGAIFTEQIKPFEVEICVAEVGWTADGDQLYRLTYDGSIVDEPQYVVMGGQADAITSTLKDSFSDGLELADAAQLAIRALSSGGEGSRELAADQLEVAVLERDRPHRTFRRVRGAALRALLPGAGSEGAGEAESGEDGDKKD